MRSYGGVLAGNLMFAAVCCFPAPVALAVGYAASRDGQHWAWIPFVIGLAGLGFIPVLAHQATRSAYPRVTRRDRLRHSDITYADDSFVLWAPRSEPGSPEAELTRADVLHASLVRYSPDGEATYTTYRGDLTPDEFTPLIRMRLRVHDWDGTGRSGFEVTDHWRVPSLCLSAVTAGRLVVLVDPAGRGDAIGPFADPRPAVVPQWPRSTLFAGTRTSRLIGLDGQLTEVTRRPERLLRQMRVSQAAGGVAMAGDVIDLRRLDPYTAARYTELAERWQAEPEELAPVSEPGEDARLLTDDLPGAPAGFGWVPRGWSRRGGVLMRARFLQMTATHTFQENGPVLDTVLRIRPPDGTQPFDAVRRLTVPMNYLALLHRTKEAVLTVPPNGRSYDVDWHRTNLLAGTTPATVVAPDGHEFSLTGRPDLIWALMNVLAAQGISNPHPVLDLRQRRLDPVRATVMDVVRGGLSESEVEVDPDPARRVS
ncbi:hypothetical protein ABZX40_03595 [Streptomyces sp. NPDC004610]|uniref:hypothetical protein n=1 Tax=unclassified Streptomyces TaxID=2593676 RepID=UPI0033AA9BEF